MYTPVTYGLPKKNTCCENLHLSSRLVDIIINHISPRSASHCRHSCIKMHISVMIYLGRVTTRTSPDRVLVLCAHGIAPPLAREEAMFSSVLDRISKSLGRSCNLHLFSGCQEARKLSFPAGCFCSDGFTCTGGTEWIYDINWCPPACVAY